MNSLSEALMDLGRRIKRLEDSAAAAREKNRRALQARREELEAAIDREVIQVEETVSKTGAAVRSWWADSRASIERQVDAMRADFEKWQAQVMENDAERAARNAEEDAAAAITLACYGIDAAEWAVVRAELTRADAEELRSRRQA